MRRAFAIVATLTGLALLTIAAGAQERGAPVVVADLDGPIDPSSAAWVDDAVETADERGAGLLVLRLNTPGGLDTSMRDIVRRIIDAPVPVAVYVAPDGARAASAGMFITIAAPVAAMAPQTNIGSATPVNLGGGETDEVLGRKVRNDAAAYARALAEGRGRNGDLAEEMVTDATNVTAAQALARDLIDVVASDTTALLREIDGRTVALGAGERTLRTAGAPVETIDKPFLLRVQSVLVNPTVAYILLLAGLAGLVLEVLSPGLGGPGLFGAVALVLGLYGTAQLPVTAAGILLLLLGAGLLIGEFATGSGGLLAAAAAVALAAAGILLFDTDTEALQVSIPVVVGVTGGLVALAFFAASRALRLRRSPARGGFADVVGREAVVRTDLDPVGHVLVDGELWRARPHDQVPLAPGAHVEVLDVDDELTLAVRRIPDPPEVLT